MSKTDTEAIRKIVGANIRKHRLANHLTITALASYLGITPGYLGLIERGARGVTVKNLHIISEVLNVPSDTFFLQEDGENKEEIVTVPNNSADSIKIKIMRKLDQMNDKELQFVMKMVLSLKEL